MPFFFTSSSNYANNNENDAETAKRSRSEHVCREVRNQSQDDTRKEKADRGGTCGEKRDSTNDASSLGIDGSLPDQRSNRRSCESARRENLFAHSERVNELFLNKFTKRLISRLTIYQMVNTIETVRLEAANSFPENQNIPVPLRAPA